MSSDCAWVEIRERSLVTIAGATLVYVDPLPAFLAVAKRVYCQRLVRPLGHEAVERLLQQRSVGLPVRGQGHALEVVHVGAVLDGDGLALDHPGHVPGLRDRGQAVDGRGLERP